MPRKEAFCRKENNRNRVHQNAIRLNASRDGVHFHAGDIDWDRLKVDPSDPRWQLHPKIHPIANHEWHRKELTEEDRIRLGIQMYAHTFLVGAQFELALMAGAAAHSMRLSTTKDKSRHSDFQYIMQEVADEANHDMMFVKFNEKVQEAGISTTDGASPWFRKITPAVAQFAYNQPAGFWTGVYMGEAPIERVQENMIALHDSGEVELPEVLENVIKIHISEERRHIAFVKDYLSDVLGEDSDGNLRIDGLKRSTYKATYPATLAFARRLITYPNKDARKVMGIPDKVARQTSRSKYAKEYMLDLVEDPIEFAHDNGLMDSRLGRISAKVLGVYDKEFVRQLDARQ